MIKKIFNYLKQIGFINIILFITFLILSILVFKSFLDIKYQLDHGLEEEINGIFEGLALGLSLGIVYILVIFILIGFLLITTIFLVLIIIKIFKIKKVTKTNNI